MKAAIHPLITKSCALRVRQCFVTRSYHKGDISVEFARPAIRSLRQAEAMDTAGAGSASPENAKNAPVPRSLRRGQKLTFATDLRGLAFPGLTRIHLELSPRCKAGLCFASASRIRPCVNVGQHGVRWCDFTVRQGATEAVSAVLPLARSRSHPQPCWLPMAGVTDTVFRHSFGIWGDAA